MFMNPIDYYSLRDHIACDIMHGRLDPTPEAISRSVRSGAGVTLAVAADFTERFFDDIQRHAGNGSKR
jgi:hypothetical protein